MSANLQQLLGKLRKVSLTTTDKTIRSIDSYDPEYHRSLRLVGSIPFTACVKDNRFSYAAYVPLNYLSLSSKGIPLVVLIHGSSREAAELRTDFASFAEEHGCAVLAPLFPHGIVEPNDDDNYKYLVYQGIRFDQILLAMVNELGQRYPKIKADAPFCLYGFSGGGQFVHRFCYLQPHRVRAAVIGAPGSVTILDDEAPWPAGIQDLEERFSSGAPLDTDALRKVEMLFVVGEHDTSTDYLFAGGHLSKDVSQGTKVNNRQEELRRLEQSCRENGNSTRLEIVSGIGHEGAKMLEPVKKFFEPFLS